MIKAVKCVAKEALVEERICLGWALIQENYWLSFQSTNVKLEPTI